MELSIPVCKATNALEMMNNDFAADFLTCLDMTSWLRSSQLVILWQFLNKKFIQNLFFFL